MLDIYKEQQGSAEQAADTKCANCRTEMARIAVENVPDQYRAEGDELRT